MSSSHQFCVLIHFEYVIFDFLIFFQTQWYKSLIENDNAVKKYYFPKEAYAKYFRSRLAGNPDYDVLIQ